MANNGKKVVIRRGLKQSYILTPVSEDDLYFTPEMIQRIKDEQQEQIIISTPFTCPSQ